VSRIQESGASVVLDAPCSDAPRLSCYVPHLPGSEPTL
jgi:hypothetical protein